MDKCNICFLDYNNSNRKKVECVYCSYDSCTSCLEKYFLMSNNNAHCINYNCSKEFNNYFLHQNFSKKFIFNDYKKHRENILFHEQQKLLQNTQQYISYQNEKNDIIKEKNDINKKINNLRKKLKELEQDLIINQHNIDDYIEDVRNNLQVNTDKKLENCPDINCNGYIEDNVCGVCRKKVCENCFELLNNNHKCSEDTLKSIKEIKKNYKKCPYCKVPIQRSEGCNQMFCTNCHIFFNYVTCKPIKKTVFVENPHHNEWISNNLEINSLTVDKCNVTFGKILHLPIPKKNAIKIAQIYLLNSQIQTEMINNNISNKNVDMLFLRVNYIKGNINKDTFKTKIQRLEKSKQKLIDTNEIRKTYIKVCYYLLNNLLEIAKNKNCLQEKHVHKEIDEMYEDYYYKVDNVGNIYSDYNSDSDSDPDPDSDSDSDFNYNSDYYSECDCVICKNYNINKESETVIKKVKRLRKYIEEQLDIVGSLYNSKRPHLSMEYFKSLNIEKTKMIVINTLGDSKCISEYCTNIKSDDINKNGYCNNCHYSYMRKKRIDRQSELYSNGLSIEEIENVLVLEGLFEYF